MEIAKSRNDDIYHSMAPPLIGVEPRLSRIQWLHWIASSSAFHSSDHPCLVWARGRQRPPCFRVQSVFIIIGAIIEAWMLPPWRYLKCYGHWTAVSGSHVVGGIADLEDPSYECLVDVAAADCRCCCCRCYAVPCHRVNATWLRVVCMLIRAMYPSPYSCRLLALSTLYPFFSLTPWTPYSQANFSF